jgi:Asp-tRNA(Asn)/Glu-tRNA(Gln) amidotransferase A subunit family amidase
MPSAQALVAQSFEIVEATIDNIHAAYRAGILTARQLVQMYLDRIGAYDKKGPTINAIISLDPTALQEADRLDAAFKRTGFVGPLHGIPVIMKDQADIKGMPTTLGSALFKDYTPERDCFVVSKLKKAGVIFLGKATLGELGGGDTHRLSGVARVPASRPISVPSRSGKRGLRRSVGPRPGTASPACAQPWGW